MASDRVHVEAHVGRKKVWSEKQTLRVHFHDFANLKHGRDECVQSPNLQCHGHEWVLKLYPGGEKEANEDRVSLHICLNDDRTVEEPVVAKYTVKTTHASRPVVVKGEVDTFYGWAFPDALIRSRVLDPSNGYLVDGTLTITLELQICADEVELWTPPSSLKTDNLAALRSGENADVTFNVQSKTFKAHRFLLGLRAPVLYSLSENTSKDEIIQIDGVDPDRFYSLLHYVYACDLPQDEDLKHNARKLLEVADKFDCAGLKMIAEAHLASSEITVDSAADLFLLGDSRSCPLLKEAAIDFFCHNSKQVIQSEGYSRLKESPALLSELWESLSQCGDHEGDESFTVSNLRKRLHEAGEDVDGTKEVLLKRFKKMKTHQ